MIKILAIVGSPRIGGNTERLVEEALNAAEEEGAETEMVRLANKDIKPCDACLACAKTKKCRIRDDFEEIFKKMADADGIIIASPVYFGSATPQIKALMDRAGYVSGSRGRVFEDKVGGAMAVARRAGQNFTLAQIIFFFLIEGMIVPGSTYWNVAFGDRKGEVAMDEEGMRTARNFGRKVAWLIGKLKRQDKPTPPP